MNASAKVTAVLLACAALGTAVFSGCTVNSTSNNDTDGGNTSGSSGSTSGDGTSGGSTSGTTGTGTDGGGTGVPVGTGCAENKQKEGVVSVECQTCLETKCCTELKGCFNVAATGDKVDCDDYATCASKCHDDAAAEADGGDPSDLETACITDLCNPAAVDGIPAAYDAIIACGEKTENCKDACGL